MKKDFILLSSENHKIRITTYGYENIDSAPCIIYVHGFKGFKDWGFVPYIGEFFASQGYFFISFNFSHNGVGENLLEFDELDKFASNTFSREIEELDGVIDAYRFGFFENKNVNDVALLGHSRGGAVALLAASNNNVNCLSVWASIAKLDRYSDRQKDEWKKQGFFEVLNSRTNQMMKLNYSLLEDIENNKHDRLNIENAVSNLKIPLQIIHGEQDLAVPFSEGEEIYNWSNKEVSEFVPVPKAGHTFDIQHPFQGSNEKFDFVLNKTLEFYNKNLKRG